MFAKIADVRLGMESTLVLGLSVWLAYAADRWIEGWRLPSEKTHTPRHQFYQRQRWPVAVIWVLVLATDLTLAFTRLGMREILAGCALLAAVLAYLLSHQLLHRHHPWRAPKEVCVAALLSGGAALFPLVNATVATRVLAPAVGLFALLCFVNCALISVWEREVDAMQGQTSLAQQFRGTASFSYTLPWMVALIAILFAVAETGIARDAGLCASVSGVLLGIVHHFEPRLGWQRARLLADAVLLTPLFPLIVSAAHG